MASAGAALSASAARAVPSSACSQRNPCTLDPRSCQTNRSGIGTRTASPGWLRWSRRGQRLTPPPPSPHYAAAAAAAALAAAVWWRECRRPHAIAPRPVAAPDRHGQRAVIPRARVCGWQNQPRAAALR
eukprot:scaffold8400_cov69-Phaeocystis_antarctica.AAC.2